MNSENVSVTTTSVMSTMRTLLLIHRCLSPLVCFASFFLIVLTCLLLLEILCVCHSRAGGNLHSLIYCMDSRLRGNDMGSSRNSIFSRLRRQLHQEGARE